MSDVNANIGINFETQKALASLRQLQAGISRFNQALTAGNADAADAQKALNAQLIQSVNATGKFVASIKTVSSSTTAFTDALEKNKLSMKEYFRFTAAAATSNTKTFSKFFASERQIFNRAAKDRVKALQTQYIQLTNANGDLVKVLQVVPKHLQGVSGQYADYATKVQMAAQRQQMMNQLIKQGSTQLLNFGKNTQWAGRQLMVGFTLPLMMLGGLASRTFMEMEKEIVKFKKVYGEMFTAEGDTDRAVESIKRLAQEFTKYGIAVRDTVAMASDAAAMGLSGAALTAQVTQATRLAVLGEVEQQQALQTTISLQNAFGVSTEELASKINFLNAVENQTVTAIEDLTIAIPKAGPVVKQLGGSVEDLAYFLTAMREGGINASEGANALKSGLASMINPTKQTTEMLAELGINIKGIIESNAGNLKMTVLGVAQAMDTLDPLNRARAIEQMFGKFQFARISALFANITKDSSQAARALQLTQMSAEELAVVSERELSKVEESVGVKFQKTLEQLKVELMPLGKAFLEAVTPIVQFAGKMLEKFNGLSDGVKKAITVVIGVVGAFAPILLMSIGLVANGVANLIKFFGLLRSGMAKLNGANNVLGGGFDYLTQQETENLAQSNALHTSHQQLIETFNVEAASLNMLADAYGRTTTQARALAASSPGLFNINPGPAGAVSGLPMNSGGLVPGSGNKDTVPAMLTPGEFVLTKDVVENNPAIVAALHNGSIQQFNNGGSVGESQSSNFESILAAKQPAYIVKEFDRINNLTESQLKRFAQLTGMSAETSMEEIRKAIVDKLKAILSDVETQFGSVTQANLNAIGKKMDPEKGYSPMGSYFEKFDQKYRPEFSHTGQADIVKMQDIERMNIGADTRTGLDVLKSLGLGDKDFRVADAYGFRMQGKINRAMADPTAAKNYQAKYGTSLNADMIADFKSRGAGKWSEMVDMAGGNFDDLKGQIELFDNKLAGEIEAWIAANPDGLINDDILMQLASKVEVDIQSLAPEFTALIQKAKDTITAIRVSLSKEELGQANALAESRGLGKNYFGTKTGNAKLGNIEARKSSEVLGTGIIEALEESTGTASPSKKTIAIGKDVARGLSIGMQSEQGNVRSQADKLAESSIPNVMKKDAVLIGQTSDSSVAVLENTEDLVVSSGDAADAQRIHADTVVTTSDIADAAADSTQDIATAAALGADAQMDSAVTAQQIADKDQQILAAKEQQLQTIQNNNMEELSNGRLSQADAFKEASKFARDENGQIILGPNGPLTTKQIQDMKRGQRRMAVGKYSGKLTGGLGVATMAAGMLGASPKVTAGLGMATMAAQFAPMLAGLTGPQGIAVAAVAVAGGLYMLNKKLENAAKAQAEYIKSISANTDKMKKIGEMSGQVGSSELMAKRRQSGQLQGYNEAGRVGQEFGSTFLGSEIGKEINDSFVKNMEKVGAPAASQALALELSSYISDGVLTAEQATSIAQQIASNLGNVSISTAIVGQFRQILGPNGEDLETSPVETRIRLIAQADKRSQGLLSAATRNIYTGQIQGRDTAAQLSALDSNTVQLAQAQADAVSRIYDDQVRLLESEIASTTNKEKQVQLEEKLAKLKSEQAAAELRMNQQVGSSIDKAVQNFAQNVQSSGINAVEDAYFDSLKSQVRDAYAGTDFESQAGTAMSRLAKVSDNRQFRAQGFENKDAAQQFEVQMDLLMANKVLNPAQVNTMLDMFNGQLGELDAALDIGIKTQGAGKSAELISMLSTVTDPDAKKIANKIAISLLKKNPQEFDKNAKAIAMIKDMDQNEVNMDVMLNTKGEAGINELAQDLDKIENIETPITKEVVQDFIKANPDMPELQQIIDDWDYYGKMDSEVLKEAMQRFKTIYEYETDFTDPEARLIWQQNYAREQALAASDGGKSTTVFDHVYQMTLNNLTGMTVDELQALERQGAAENASGQVQTYYGNKVNEEPKTPPGDPTGDKTGKNPLDFLDQLAMRIKNVRDGAFNATKPLESMLAAFTSKKAQKNAANMFKIFDGLQQRLIKMKAPKEFRDMIMGMSAEDFDKLANLKGNKAIFKFEKGKPRTKANITGLTKTGQALMQTYREAQVGEFQVAQREIIQNVANQDKAFRMLVASGMSASDALAVVQDTAQAAAIAAETLGKKGSAEMKKYVKDIQTANTALERQAVINNLIAKNEEFELFKQMPQLASTLAGMGMSADQINAALSDPQLSKYLIQDLKDGKIDAKEIADYLNSIEARKIIDIQIKYNQGDFAGAASEGQQLVNEMFSVQEALIRTGVDTRSAGMVAELNANNKQLKTLNMELTTAQRKLAEMNEELSDGQRAIEENYNRPIEAMQEQVSDLERTLETHPIFGNRVIKGLQDESNILSNDLQIIGFQTEKINEKYDKQAEALQKVSEINQNIINQQKQQLGLADALTQGDIAAAARAAQEMRATDAQMFSDTATQALEQSRQNEIDALRGAQSGLSAKEIADRQFFIAQEIYRLENDPARVAIQQQILDLQDKIYDLGELREEQLLKLRDLEDQIYYYNENVIEPIQNQIDQLTYRNTILQDAIDTLVDEIEVLGRNRAEWDKINAKIDASALASKNLDAAFGALLASVASIDAMWTSILSKIAAYAGGVPASVTTAQGSVVQNSATAKKESRRAEILGGAMPTNAEVLEYSPLAKANEKYFKEQIFEPMESGEQLLPSAIIDYANAVNEARKTPGAMVALARGGMVPKRFAKGGYSMGTDTVPAMLTPGEFVMSKYAVSNYGLEKMKAINSGEYNGESVYNYSVSVNVQSDANPQQIADAVMRQIKQVDSQRIRGTRI